MFKKIISVSDKYQLIHNLRYRHWKWKEQMGASPIGISNSDYLLFHQTDSKIWNIEDSCFVPVALKLYLRLFVRSSTKIAFTNRAVWRQQAEIHDACLLKVQIFLMSLCHHAPWFLCCILLVSDVFYSPPDTSTWPFLSPSCSLSPHLLNRLLAAEFSKRNWAISKTRCRCEMVAMEIQTQISCQKRTWCCPSWQVEILKVNNFFICGIH